VAASEPDKCEGGVNLLDHSVTRPCFSLILLVKCNCVTARSVDTVFNTISMCCVPLQSDISMALRIACIVIAVKEFKFTYYSIRLF
jgi:hypothetical protein